MRITDAHTHVFPAPIAVKAATAIGDFYDGVKMWGDGTVEMLVENCKKVGIERTFTHSVATTPKQVTRINEFIAECVAKSEGLMIGFATMHPDFQDVGGELDRALDLGLVGVKLHPDMQHFAIDDPRAMHIYEEMSKRNMPLVAHTGDVRYDYSNPKRTAHVLRSFPTMRVQAAHFGCYSVWDEVLEVFEGLEVYTDLSSSFFAMDNALAEKLIAFFGSDHVMFGSDYPMWDANEELKRFNTLNLNQNDRENILWNASENFLHGKMQESNVKNT